LAHSLNLTLSCLFNSSVRYGRLRRSSGGGLWFDWAYDGEGLTIRGDWGATVELTSIVDLAQDFVGRLLHRPVAPLLSIISCRLVSNSSAGTTFGCQCEQGRSSTPSA